MIATTSSSIIPKITQKLILEGVYKVEKLTDHNDQKAKLPLLQIRSFRFHEDFYQDLLCELNFSAL